MAGTFASGEEMSTCVQYNPITANLVNAIAFPCARKNVLVHAGYFVHAYCKIVLPFLLIFIMSLHPCVVVKCR